MVEEFIVFWKDAPGQQVSTTVDAYNNPVRRDAENLEAQGIPVLRKKDDVLSILNRADGTKVAIAPDLARSTLGWDI